MTRQTLTVVPWNNETNRADNDRATEIPATVTPYLPNKGTTQRGYGNAMPTRYMVKINGRNRRVYVCQYSNAGTAYIGTPKRWEYVVRD